MVFMAQCKEINQGRLKRDNILTVFICTHAHDDPEFLTAMLSGFPKIPG